MKKKVISSVVFFALFTLTSINVYQNRTDSATDLLLDNIEAAANTESGSVTGKCTGYSEDTYCFYRCSCGTLYQSGNKGTTLESISGTCVSCGKQL